MAEAPRQETFRVRFWGALSVLGLVFAALSFGVDQTFNWWMLHVFDIEARQPVALLFATPQLCQSRVCGPVVDIALQLKQRYGDQIDFIHQEVYVDNDPNKGLRPPLRAFALPTEPWLFTFDSQGRVAARLEGSFGLRAFEDALKAAIGENG